MSTQVSSSRARQSPGRFQLQAERLGPLPLVNHFIGRLGLEPLLERHLPTTDKRTGLSSAKALGVLLRSIIVEREPIYRQQETVPGFAPGMYGLNAEQMERLNDDQIGRALDRLFDADRAALLTEAVLAAAQAFNLSLKELHNDSTTVRLSGRYAAARGRRLRGRRAPWITYGHSKDHRPDLKQLLFILTTTADGAIPVQFRCGDGNTNDATTHVDTWQSLRSIAGRADFLYVADSKLCTHEAMSLIDGDGGRFVTVLPRSRLEDGEFRHWIQEHQPAWDRAWDRPNPRRRRGPRDRWWVWRHPLPSQEGWPVTWVYSSLLALHQQQSRRERIARAVELLQQLKERLDHRRCRLRTAAELERRIEQILERYKVGRYLKVRRFSREEHRYRQQRRGRPGPRTTYVRTSRRLLDIEWATDEAAVAYDCKSDGMYPLLSNDRSLTPLEVLQAHKGQPKIEKRFSQLKSVHEIAPGFLKNEGRIEALFTLYFLALMVQALIERELRRAMKREAIAQLPIYPEERRCHRPTTEQVLRLFSLAVRHTLLLKGRLVQAFGPDLTHLQTQILALLGVPPTAYGMAE